MSALLQYRLAGMRGRIGQWRDSLLDLVEVLTHRAIVQVQVLRPKALQAPEPIAQVEVTHGLMDRWARQMALDVMGFLPGFPPSAVEKWLREADPQAAQMTLAWSEAQLDFWEGFVAREDDAAFGLTHDELASLEALRAVHRTLMGHSAFYALDVFTAAHQAWWWSVEDSGRQTQAQRNASAAKVRTAAMRRYGQMLERLIACTWAEQLGQRKLLDAHRSARFEQWPSQWFGCLDEAFKGAGL